MTYLRCVLLVSKVSLLAQVRRRVTSLLLILLPILLFAAMRTSGRSLGIAALGVGLAWSLSIFGAFGVRSNAGLDGRLSLGGLRQSRILAGRLLSFGAVAVSVSAVLAIIIPQLDDGLDPLVLMVGLLMAAAVAVTVGVLVGLLAPGELESVLIIIGIFGVPLGLPLDSVALQFAPGYGSIMYLQYLGDRTDLSFFLHAGAVSLGATVIAWFLWSRRTRRADTLR